MITLPSVVASFSLGQLVAHVRQRGMFAVAESNAPLDLVTQNPLFRDQIFVAQQQFLIDRPCDVCQPDLPVHRLPPQPLSSLLTLSMGERRAEDKSKRRRCRGVTSRGKTSSNIVTIRVPPV